MPKPGKTSADTSFHINLATSHLQKLCFIVVVFINLIPFAKNKHQQDTIRPPASIFLLLLVFILLFFPLIHTHSLTLNAFLYSNELWVKSRDDSFSVYMIMTSLGRSETLFFNFVVPMLIYLQPPKKPPQQS